MEKQAAEMGGWIDRLIDPQLRERLSPERFAVALDMLHDAFQSHIQEIAELASQASLALLVGPPEGMRGVTSDHQEVARGFVRFRLVNAAMREKGCSRRQAREAVKQLAAEQIDAAMGPIPVEAAGDFFAGLWQWIVENWPKILAALLPFILMLL